MYKLKYKLWLDKNGKVFGDGPYKLLKGISSSGSLVTAAKEQGMSYSQAHTLLKNIENRLGFPLLVSKVGGTGGGGSDLTPAAKELIKKYEALSIEAAELLAVLYKKHFEAD